MKEKGNRGEEEMVEKEELLEEKWEEVEEKEKTGEVGEEQVVVGGAFQAVSMETSEAPPRLASPLSPSSLQALARSLEVWAGPTLGAGRVGLRSLSWRW